MPFNPQDAVDAAWNIINGPRTFERARLDNIKAALRPNVADPTVEIPLKAPPIMRKLAIKARTNVLPLVLDARCFARRFTSPDDCGVRGPG
jgi:hypothetical protein